VRRIDTIAATQAEGVIAVLTAGDLAPWIKPLRPTRPFPDGLDQYRQLPLGRDEVRYVGEPLAIVVAETRSLALDAAARVELDIDEMPAVMDTGEARPVHVITKRAGASITEAWAAAPVQVEATFKVGRNTGMPMETRGLVVSPELDGGVSLYGVTKLPGFVRLAIAEVLGVGPLLVRVRPVATGGGFGVRGELYVEDILVTLAAQHTAHPVAWIEDRSEHLASINHARESVWRVRAGASSEGRLLALSGQVDIDAGAYLRTLVPAELDASELLGPYRVPAYECEARMCLTNKMGIGTMRAPGTYESTFVREMLIEKLAARLGLAGAEVRRRNLLTPEELPLEVGFDLLGSGVVYDSADLPTAFDMAADAITTDLDDARLKARTAGKRLGVGVVPVLLPTGIGPFETARLAVEPPGVLAVYVATTSMGQGHTTSLAQIAAEAVGVGVERVVVHEGDPATVPASIGTFASRSMVAAGTAVWTAGLQLREQLSELGGDGPIDLAMALQVGGSALEASAKFDIPTLTYAYGAHAALVQLDPELGTVEPLRYVVVADAGRVINPDSALDQILGGVVFGIGGALLESIEYSPDGQLRTASFLDFLMPTIAEVPVIDVWLIDRARSPLNPLGVKGVAEIGTAAAGAAIAVAAQDALGRKDRWIDELPLSLSGIRDLSE